KRVELARALAAEPQLLLLDEPMAGMNVEEKEDMCRFILDVNGEFGTTMTLIEHDMGVVMDICDRVVVLDYGRKIADGTPEQVRTVAVMVLLAFVIERVVLRPLVNQEPIILFMATIGLNFFLEGFGEMVWGANVKRLDVGIPDTSFKIGNVLVNRLELTAAITAAVLVTVLAVFFQKTGIGRALRAVADDHEAALSLGIPLKTIWAVVGAVAGLVAIVAGILWGAKSGVQFSLSLIALQALPVLILGGFAAVPGAIAGGLIIGVSEKIAEVYWGPLVGGAIENWFAYVL